MFLQGQLGRWTGTQRRDGQGRPRAPGQDSSGFPRAVGVSRPSSGARSPPSGGPELCSLSRLQGGSPLPPPPAGGSGHPNTCARLLQSWPHPHRAPLTVLSPHEDARSCRPPLSPDFSCVCTHHPAAIQVTS